MMMKYSEHEIKVVIGASYGDEGKGLMTDCFCRNALEKEKTVLQYSITAVLREVILYQ